MKRVAVVALSFVAGAATVMWLAEEPSPPAAQLRIIPVVEASCESWHIQETAPGFYWDGTELNGESFSSADYYTIGVLHNGVVTQSEHHRLGEWTRVPPSDNGQMVITYWDSDRPGEPEPLARYAYTVTPPPECRS